MILRGANDYMLDEMDRALHDALSIVKRTLESNMVTFCILAFSPTSVEVPRVHSRFVYYICLVIT